MVFCTTSKPEKMFAGTSVESVPEYLKVHVSEALRSLPNLNSSQTLRTKNMAATFSFTRGPTCGSSFSKSPSSGKSQSSRTTSAATQTPLSISWIRSANSLKTVSTQSTAAAMAKEKYLRTCVSWSGTLRILKTCKRRTARRATLSLSASTRPLASLFSGRTPSLEMRRQLGTRATFS